MYASKSRDGGKISTHWRTCRGNLSPNTNDYAIHGGFFRFADRRPELKFHRPMIAQGLMTAVKAAVATVVALLLLLVVLVVVMVAAAMAAAGLCKLEHMQPHRVVDGGQ